ncbi:MAG: LuxR C-terminal-related transcriptional regulator [Bacteroidetes bacterium]|nr:LuxR C-terminal-related transcriptional regulator [Bacteroidota bacterium]MCL5737218.1 LuxR C-terminal-related transcriptional regulator [Bacteroidota bacterium]
MTTQEFSILKSYARTFAHTEDDADDLLLLTYQESLRLGAKCTIALLVNFMRLSAKSIAERSFLPLDEVGKSRFDAFNKEKFSLSDPLSSDGSKQDGAIRDVIASDSCDPFDEYVANEFAASLNEREKNVLSELLAGYSVREICKSHGISSKTFEHVRASLRLKAGKHLL